MIRTPADTGRPWRSFAGDSLLSLNPGQFKRRSLCLKHNESEDRATVQSMGVETRRGRRSSRGALRTHRGFLRACVDVSAATGELAIRPGIEDNTGSN